MSDNKPMIKYSPSYETRDGKKFFDLGEAQEYTRTRRLEALHFRLLRMDPQFALIPVEAFIKAMKAVAVDAAAIMTNKMEPAMPSGGPVGLTDVDGSTVKTEPGKSPLFPGSPLEFRDARPVGMPLELGMPYMPTLEDVGRDMQTVLGAGYQTRPEIVDRDVISDADIHAALASKQERARMHSLNIGDPRDRTLFPFKDSLEIGDPLKEAMRRVDAQVAETSDTLEAELAKQIKV